MKQMNREKYMLRIRCINYRIEALLNFQHVHNSLFRYDSKNTNIEIRQLINERELLEELMAMG